MYKTDWDLTKLLPAHNFLLIDEELEQMTSAVKTFRDKWYGDASYLTASEKLLEALVEYEKLIDNYFPLKVGYYAFLRLELNQTDEEAKKIDSKITELATEAENLIQFFSISISKLPENIQKTFLNEPSLTRYRHHLEKLFELGKHTLSDAEEKILNLKSSVSHGRWESMTSEILSKQKKDVLQEDGSTRSCTYNEISNLFLSKKSEVRTSAFNAVKEIYNALTEVGVSEMNAILENKKLDDKLRNYDSPEDSRLLDDDMDKEVVDKLVTVVSKNYGIVERFYNLKAKLLGMDSLGYEDRNAPVGNLEMNLDFEQAMDIVKNVFKEINPEFADIINSFAQEGLIDVYPKEGKHHGAFCVKGSSQIPPYVLLNYKSDLDNIQTLAHELGHALNHYYINNNNTGVYMGSSTAIAEVASTFFEGRVLSQLEKSFKDNRDRLSFLMIKLNDIVNTVFRQVSFYEVERDLHREFRKKFNLSLEEYDEIYSKNIKKFSKGCFKNADNLKGFWIGIPHFRYFFYVYSYSSGLLISQAMSYTLKIDKSFADKIKTFLTCGSDKSPYELFLELGIDLKKEDFWNNSILEIEEMLTNAEEIAKELNFRIT